jgi:NADPH2:quinone reductase
MPNYLNVKVNQGDDVGGIVTEVGANVTNFRPGDRVAGFHQMDTPRGTYAEYTVCPKETVFHIPVSMSFEEAATIPLTANTAAVGLFRNLSLPLPFSRSDTTPPTALIINGSGGAVGSFALKLAVLNPAISPIIAIASANGAASKELGAHVVLDYRSRTIAADVQAALGEGKKATRILDCVNSERSLAYLLPVLDKQGKYTCTTGITPPQKKALEEWGGWFEQIWVGSVHEDKPAGGKMFGAVMSTVLEELIAQGKFKGHNYAVVKDGLNGVKDALIDLRDRKGGNDKFVVRIGDTPGL